MTELANCADGVPPPAVHVACGTTGKYEKLLTLPPPPVVVDVRHVPFVVEASSFAVSQLGLLNGWMIALHLPASTLQAQPEHDVTTPASMPKTGCDFVNGAGHGRFCPERMQRWYVLPTPQKSAVHFGVHDVSVLAVHPGAGALASHLTFAVEVGGAGTA